MGNRYMIEANLGRPAGRSAIAEAGGVELLFTMYCDVVGLPLPENRVQRYQGAKWIDLRHDLQSVLGPTRCRSSLICFASCCTESAASGVLSLLLLRAGLAGAEAPKLSPIDLSDSLE